MKLKKFRSVFIFITAFLAKEKMDLKKSSRHEIHIYTHYNKWRRRHSSGSPFKNEKEILALSTGSQKMHTMIINVIQKQMFNPLMSN